MGFQDSISAYIIFPFICTSFMKLQMTLFSVYSTYIFPYHFLHHFNFQNEKKKRTTALVLWKGDKRNPPWGALNPHARIHREKPGLPLLQRYPNGEKYGGRIFQGGQLGRKKMETVWGKGKEARKEFIGSCSAQLLPFSQSIYTHISGRKRVQLVFQIASKVVHLLDGLSGGHLVRAVQCRHPRQVPKRGTQEGKDPPRISCREHTCKELWAKGALWPGEQSLQSPSLLPPHPTTP